MPSFFERFDISGSNRKQKASEPVADQCCPTIAEAMSGDFDPATGYCRIPSMSVTIFLDHGEFKAVLGAGPAFRRFYLTLDTLEAACEQVERAIAEGRGEWREPVSPKVLSTRQRVNGKV